MRVHHEQLLSRLPAPIPDDAIFRPSQEGTTYDVKLSSLDYAQLYLHVARKCTCINKTLGFTAQLDGTFKKSDERRARSRALHPASVALTELGYTRDTIIMQHAAEATGHFTRISVAVEDGASPRLGVARYTSRPDGSRAVAAFDIEDVAAASKLDVIDCICGTLSLRP